MSEQTTPAPTAGRKYFTLAEAAEYSRMSARTLRRLAQEGRLKLHRPRGGRALVDAAALEALIRAS